MICAPLRNGQVGLLVPQRAGKVTNPAPGDFITAWASKNVRTWILRKDAIARVPLPFVRNIGGRECWLIPIVPLLHGAIGLHVP